jgi:alpha-aminoadipic semialdehyde synthase
VFHSFKGPGILVCSIDNMPTQLPREATDFFGDLLLPHVFDVLQSDATKPFEEHKFTNVIEGAVITSNGKLTKNFEYIQDLRNQRKWVFIVHSPIRFQDDCNNIYYFLF